MSIRNDMINFDSNEICEEQIVGIFDAILHCKVFNYLDRQINTDPTVITINETRNDNKAVKLVCAELEPYVHATNDIENIENFVSWWIGPVSKIFDTYKINPECFRTLRCALYEISQCVKHEDSALKEILEKHNIFEKSSILQYSLEKPSNYSQSLSSDWVWQFARAWRGMFNK